MKIEKVNDNQIRCTLTREDLASRQIKISELAYGTEKAKSLFRDMMQMANFEFGFEAEDIPLMIEAIPLNAECIVLIITKVEDPEELDTRFSRFAPADADEDEEEEDLTEEDENQQEMLDLFRRLHETKENTLSDTSRVLPGTASDKVQETNKSEEAGRSRIFIMNSLHEVMSAAAVTADRYHGESALYKDDNTQKYLLILTQGASDRDDFDRISNIISEYGVLQRSMSAGPSFLMEHYEPLIAEKALQKLAS